MKGCLNYKKVLLVGHFGAGNAGDDAMGVGTLYSLREYSVEARILTKTRGIFEKYGFDFLTEKDFSIFNIISSIIWANRVIIAGGSHFNDFDSHMFRRYRVFIFYLALVTFSKCLRREVHLIGQGFGPIERYGFKLIFRIIVRLADFISVRDSDSLKIDFLDTRDWVKAFDLAAFIPLKKREGLESNIVGISITPANRKFYRKPEEDKKLCETLAAALNDLEEVDEIDIFVFHTGSAKSSDVGISEELKNNLNFDNVKLVCYENDPVNFLHEVGRCKYFIGMKLHSIVFAYLNNVPVLTIAYHPKCSSFAEYVGYEPTAIVNISELTLKELKKRISLLTQGSGDFKPSMELNRAMELLKRNLTKEF